MALPGLNDLLPDHLFHHPSRARAPPPSSILQHVPAWQPPYPAHTVVAYPYHQPQPVSRPPPAHLPTITLGSAPRPHKRPYDARHANICGSAALSDVRGSRFDIDGAMDENDVENDNIEENENEEEGDEEKRKHACPICGKRFNRPSSLRIHLNTHTGAKPYICPFPGCNRSFNVSSNMRRHYRNHARRAPPPLPINDVVAQAQATQAQMQMQRAFSVEPPPHLRPARQRASHRSTMNTGKTTNVNVNRNENGMGSAVRGAEAAAKAARKASVSSSTSGTAVSAAKQSRHASQYPPSYIPVAQTQAQYEYPYPPPGSSSGYFPPPPPLAPFHSQPYTVHPQLPPQPSRSYTYPTSSTGYGDDSNFEFDLRYRPTPSSTYAPPPPRAPSPVATSSSTAHHPRAYESENSSHYAIPPTPPYTNEAALSPPTYAPGGARDSSSASGYAYVHEREHGYTYAKEDGRDVGYVYPRTESPGSGYYQEGWERERERDREQERVYRPPVPLRTFPADPSPAPAPPHPSATAYGDADADETWRRGGAVHSTSFTRSQHSSSYSSAPRTSERETQPPRYESSYAFEFDEYEDRHPHAHGHGYEEKRIQEQRRDPIYAREVSGYVSRYADEYSRASSVSVASRGERERAFGMVMETGPGMRQQPSPDTPSLHASVLHPNLHSSVREHGKEQVQEDRKQEEGTAPVEKAAIDDSDAWSRGHARGLSSSSPTRSSRAYSYSEALKPSYAQTGRIDASSASPQPQTQCPSQLCRASDSNSDFKSKPMCTSPSLCTSPPHSPPLLNSAHARLSGNTTAVGTDSAESKAKVVGRTPGAAPPPPYPLYTYPPPVEPEAEAEAEGAGSGEREGGRGTKKRRRG